jgi:UDP-3-O-[3-hydroxymyristoyl] glucosamine N-acyltransferase
MNEIPLLILGASFSFEVINLIQDINKMNKEKIKIVGILDDSKKFFNKKIDNIPVLGKINEIKKFKKEKINISINSFKNRFVQKKLIKKHSLKSSRFLTLIHPTAHIGNKSQIGNGSVIFQFVNIVARVKIKSNTRINPFTSITPGCVIGNNCSISHGVKIGVNSKIGDECFLGTGSTIGENVSLASGTMLCENSYANKSSNTTNCVLLGNPARTIGRS